MSNQVQISQLKYETPKNLDSIFSLECFKYLEMKALFKLIFEHLGTIGMDIGILNDKLSKIPNQDDIQNIFLRLTQAEHDISNLKKQDAKIIDDLNHFKMEINQKISAQEVQIDIKFQNYDLKIQDIYEQIEELKQRPLAINTGDLKIEEIWLSQKWIDLMKRIQLIEKRNLEQDERLTNNELRIEKLEKMINDPLQRIIQIEKRCETIWIELGNKINVQDFYLELQKKADIESFKSLESSLIKLNLMINELSVKFADRVENDKAHKLLQKNLKNLYDLFMSLKGEGTEDDPMFTTKGINCASCAKGVQNMLGFRADHIPWQNFPFKDPGQRMLKAGQGFSKIYTKSINESSYYNGPTQYGVGHQSAAELNENAYHGGEYANQKQQVGGRKARPMTAKVSKVKQNIM